MHDSEKSDSAIVAVKPPNKAGVAGCGGGGAKGRGQGKRGPAKHAPDPEPEARDPGAEPRTARASPSNTQGRSRMLELGSSGSVRGVSSNGHPYRDPGPIPDIRSGPNPSKLAALPASFATASPWD